QHSIMTEDAELMSVDAVESTQNIYLPSSFLGFNCWASEQIADSLAIAAQYGTLMFFITMTCNLQWPEIQSQLQLEQSFAQIPLVIICVFKQMLKQFEQLFPTMFPNAGHLVYLIHSIEFQK
ncbi:uncharacterized protein PHACADRAFT_98722, partial [Phanerochaete carnosa HHB-10118-sp]